MVPAQATALIYNAAVSYFNLRIFTAPFSISSYAFSSSELCF